MRRSIWILLIFCLFAASQGHGAKTQPDWKVGKIISADRARYFAGMMHNSQSTTNGNGSVNATANTSSVGNYSTTNVNGEYSGRSTTSTSGFSAPVYKVYDDLIIEGEDRVYVTQERLHWRWSKGAHVAVNSEVKYYVSGRKLHVLDDDGKEHVIEIVKEIRKQPQIQPAVTPSASGTAEARSVSSGKESSQSMLEIVSNPAGAEISIDGEFVGSTPSTISVAPGSHAVKLSKKGFGAWERRIKVASPQVRVAADLDAQTQSTSN